MTWRKNVLFKKLNRYGHNVYRVPYNLMINKNEYFKSPPILANSFPKSGTHLLIQILQVIPGCLDWGLFLASTPSFIFREIHEKKMCQKINKIVPNELVSSHLYYSDQVAKKLADKNVVHYFIYRDPRDVVVSGVHYLTYMNRWHNLHKYFKSLPDIDARIKYHIIGLADSKSKIFPNVKERFESYRRWIESPYVLDIKYENLVSNEKHCIIKYILSHYNNISGRKYDLDLLTKCALENINPYKSHTFRKGKTSSWKEYFSQDNKELFKEYAGDLLIDLGYETDFNW